MKTTKIIALLVFSGIACRAQQWLHNLDFYEAPNPVIDREHGPQYYRFRPEEILPGWSFTKGDQPLNEIVYTFSGGDAPRSNVNMIGQGLNSPDSRRYLHVGLLPGDRSIVMSQKGMFPSDVYSVSWYAPQAKLTLIIDGNEQISIAEQDYPVFTEIPAWKYRGKEVEIKFTFSEKEFVPSWGIEFYKVTTIPEPGTLGLMTLGGLAVVIALHRRSQGVR